MELTCRPGYYMAGYASTMALYKYMVSDEYVAIKCIRSPMISNECGYTEWVGNANAAPELNFVECGGRDIAQGV